MVDTPSKDLEFVLRSQIAIESSSNPAARTKEGGAR
jgi:hypothetical protein